jgi:serine/threonine protein kinase
MRIVSHLSTLALRQVIDGAFEAVGFKGGEALVGFLTRRFSDHSKRLSEALLQSNERAWKTLEFSLAGDSLWQRCKALLAPREEQAFRQQVQAFLDATPLAGLSSHGPEFREQALRELRAARKAGALGGTLDPKQLAEDAGAFARFGDPQQVLDAELQLIDGMSIELRAAGYAALAHLVALRPEKGLPILAAAVRYYFRRLVEEDDELFQGLAFAQLERLHEDQEAGFAALADVMTRHGGQLEELLGDMREVVAETLTGVLDIKSEVQKQGQQLQDLGQAVLKALDQHRLTDRGLRPGDSLSIHNDNERQLVRALVAKFRALPPEQQRQLPALLNGLGKLEVAAGEFDAARKDFQEVASLAADAAARAEAQHNTYQAALEQRHWDAALAALRQAVELDAGRWAPFPWTKYEPQRILGAGGFGVAFLCQHRKSGGRVVVKALRLDGLDREVADVFREARVLEDLDHAAIIRLKDCDFADVEETRAFLVMEYFDGLTLEDHIAQHGPLSATDLLAVARPVADALHAAHARGILHRDVKPGNLLLRRDGIGWRVKLIDFGLALKQDVLQSVSGPAQSARTTIGVSVAGTRDYAAPEQMGRLPGVKVGPHSDVYGFGKTFCYALFKTVQPLRKHWRDVPEALADLLEACLGETPEERPANFAAVLQRLEQMQTQPSPTPVAVSSEPGLPGDSRKFWAVQPASPSNPALESRSPKDTIQEIVAKKQHGRPLVARVEGRLLSGHTGAVTNVAFSPGGRFLASGSADMTVRVWDLTTGKEHRCFVGHNREVCSVAFFADGGRVLSSGEDNTVRIWNVTTGAEQRSFERRTNRAAALAPDGRLVLSGSLYDGMLRLWDANTGEELRRFQGHTDFVLGIAFAPDGRRALSVGQDQTVRLWDVATGRQLRCFDMQRRGGGVTVGAQYGPCGCAVFAPDGRHGLFGTAASPLGLWEFGSGQERRSYRGHTATVRGAAFTPDGSRIVSGSADWTVRVWDVENTQELACFTDHQGEVTSVAVSPDGRQVVSGSTDQTVRVWELPGKE